MIELEACTALVTGASAGLGEEFARQLAAVAGTVVVVARRGDRLETLKAALESKHPGLQVQVYVADLTESAEREELVAFLEREGLLPDLLINNAGMGDYGEFASADWTKTEQMLRLNIIALTHLAHLFVPVMVARGRGAILNVSSLGGEFPVPDLSVYAASKAYVTSFSEALRIEMLDHGVHVSALCPGPVSTEFGEVAAREGEGKPLPPGGKRLYVDAEKAVREGLDAVVRNRPRAFPGFFVALLAAAAGALPKVVLRAMMATRPKASGRVGKPHEQDS